MKYPICLKRHSMLEAALFAVVLLTAARYCIGQQPETRSLTLAGAISLATAQNPNVQISLLNSALANEEQRRALSALLPQASVGGKASARHAALVFGRAILKPELRADTDLVIARLVEQKDIHRSSGCARPGDDRYQHPAVAVGARRHPTAGGNVLDWRGHGLL